MPIPLCPDPHHAGSQVVRAGWYGRSSHRRQRWLCRPRNGDAPHRFTDAALQRPHDDPAGQPSLLS